MTSPAPSRSSPRSRPRPSPVRRAALPSVPGRSAVRGAAAARAARSVLEDRGTRSSPTPTRRSSSRGGPAGRSVGSKRSSTTATARSTTRAPAASARTSAKTIAPRRTRCWTRPPAGCARAGWRRCGGRSRTRRTRSTRCWSTASTRRPPSSSPTTRPTTPTLLEGFGLRRANDLHAWWADAGAAPDARLLRLAAAIRRRGQHHHPPAAARRLRRRGRARRAPPERGAGADPGLRARDLRRAALRRPAVPGAAAAGAGAVRGGRRRPRRHRAGDARLQSGTGARPRRTAVSLRVAAPRARPARDRSAAPSGARASGPAFRRRGIELLLCLELRAAARRLGYRRRRAVDGLGGQRRHPPTIAAMGGRRTKTYRILRREAVLTPALNPTIKAMLASLGADRAFVRGQGARLYDGAGREYLDCWAQYGVLALGHNPPAVVAAVRDALAAGDARLPAALPRPARRGAGRGAGAARAGRDRALPVHQLGRGDRRGGDQAGARDDGADARIVGGGRLPRVDVRRDGGERPARIPRRLRAAAGGVRHGALRRRRRARRAARARRRARPPRSSSNRSRAGAARRRRRRVIWRGRGRPARATASRSSPTRSRPGSGAPGRCSPASRKGSRPTSCWSPRRWAAGCSRSGRASPRRHCGTTTSRSATCRPSPTTTSPVWPAWSRCASSTRCCRRCPARRPACAPRCSISPPATRQRPRGARARPAGRDRAPPAARGGEPGARRPPASGVSTPPRWRRRSRSTRRCSSSPPSAKRTSCASSRR